MSEFLTLPITGPHVLALDGAPAAPSNSPDCLFLPGTRHFCSFSPTPLCPTKEHALFASLCDSREDSLANASARRSSLSSHVFASVTHLLLLLPLPIFLSHPVAVRSIPPRVSPASQSSSGRARVRALFGDQHHVYLSIYTSQ